MSEQDSEMADPESSSNGAMEELADIVSGKKPAPPAWERDTPRRPTRSGRLSKIALIIGLLTNLTVLPWLCVVGLGVGMGWGENNLTAAPVEVALIIAASLLPVGAGVVCSVIAIRRSRASGRGDTLALMALIFNLMPVIVGVIGIIRGIDIVWSHKPGTVW